MRTVEARALVFVAVLPGVLWGLLLLATRLHGREDSLSEGTFLLRATLLLSVVAVVMNAFEMMIPAALYWSTLLTAMSVALVASAVLLPAGTYATILQPLIVAGCWIFASRRAHVALRRVSLFVTIGLAMTISLMLLAAWGMGAGATLFNGEK